MFGCRRWEDNQGIGSRGLFSFGDMNRFAQEFGFSSRCFFGNNVESKSFFPIQPLGDSTIRHLRSTQSLAVNQRQDLDSDAPVVLTFILLVDDCYRVARRTPTRVYPSRPRINAPAVSRGRPLRPASHWRATCRHHEKHSLLWTNLLPERINVCSDSVKPCSCGAKWVNWSSMLSHQ